MSTLRTGVVGVGRWGRNVFRNFVRADRCEVRWICDLDQAALQREATHAPGARTTRSFEDLLRDAELDAVIIATKADTHFELARRSLDAGKHVYCEKPLALRVEDAVALRDQVRKTGLKLMVGHLMLYHPCMLKLRELIADKDLGEIYYIYSQRVNLGVVRQDENAWWSLAPHDISVACYLLNDSPVQVSAHGQCYLQPGIEDVVFATLRFADGKLAHIHVSWLDPHKTRRLTVVGSNKMATFDDMEASEKIRLYDRAVEVRQHFDSFADTISIRSGDIVIPHVDLDEPLKLEVDRFIRHVLDDEPIRSDVEEGLKVVQILHCGTESLHRAGALVEVS